MRGRKRARSEVRVRVRKLRVYTLKDSPPAVHPSTLAHGGERRLEAAVCHGVGRSVGPQRRGAQVLAGRARLSDQSRMRIPPDWNHDIFFVFPIHNHRCRHWRKFPAPASQNE